METDTSAVGGSPPKHRANRTLRIIAFFKFLEALAVVGAGLASLRLMNPDTLNALTAWTQALPALAEQNFIQRLLDQLSGVTQNKLRELGAGAFLFAAIFLAEGVGLWMEKRWAEWLSVVATSLFIPLEILELLRHASASKVIALVLNALVVGYLVVRIILTSKKTSR